MSKVSSQGSVEDHSVEREGMVWKMEANNVVFNSSLGRVEGLWARS